ncbi:MAG: DUF2927 domain-containing protein [Bacteroidota bacterium]
MKKLFSLLVSASILLVSCSDDEEVIGGGNGSDALTPYQTEVISYFKDIALGFEFGNSSRIVRKWDTDMKIFVGGRPNSTLLDELETIKDEINSLTGDEFSMEIVSDTLESNYYIFFGSAEEYTSIFPQLAQLAASNWGLFSIFWDGNQNLFRGYMYVDIERANSLEQRHLLREELTQSLGLARDSFEYPESIFQQDWTRTTSYAGIDEDLIRLLYHPQVTVGLDANGVDPVLRNILINE